MKAGWHLGAAASVAIVMAACGGGGGVVGGSGNSSSSAPQPTTFNLQTGVANMVANGLKANVSLSGSVNVNGVSTSVTGSGMYTQAPSASTTFNGGGALSQVETLSGTVTAAGQSTPYSSNVTYYYATGNSAFLGESNGNSQEFDVAQSPFEYPTMLVSGATGTLGTVSRYSNSTMSVSLGTAQVTYSAGPGSPLPIAITTKIYNTQNTLTETDVTNYDLSTGNVVSFVSASVQNSSGNLQITAQ